MDEKHLYTEEDYAAKRKQIWELIVAGFILFIVFIAYFFQSVIRFWMIPIALILFSLGSFGQIGSIKEEMKKMTTLDVLNRVFSKEFGNIILDCALEFGGKYKIKRAKLLVDVEKENYVPDGIEEIRNSSFEEEIDKRDHKRVILPRIRVQGEYKGVPFVFDEYEMYDVEGIIMEPRVNKEFTKHLVRVQLPKKFQGTVYIGQKINPIFQKQYDGQPVELESIEFNEKFRVLADTDLGAFRLLPPKTMIRMMDAVKAYGKRFLLNDMTMLFRDGGFYSYRVAKKKIRYNWGRKKVKKIDGAMVDCKDAIDFIKFYIDELNFQKVTYTTGK